MIVILRSDEMFVIRFNLKASAQIQMQTIKSSSIILALTDGKLAVYVHELTVKAVRLIFSNSCTSELSKCWNCTVKTEFMLIPTKLMLHLIFTLILFNLTANTNSKYKLHFYFFLTFLKYLNFIYLVKYLFIIFFSWMWFSAWSSCMDSV